MKYNKIQYNIKEKLIHLLLNNNHNNKYLLYLNTRNRPYIINYNHIYIYIKSLGKNIYITITLNNKMIYCKSMGKIGIHKKERKRMKSLNLFSKILVNDIFKKLKLKYKINKISIYWSGSLEIISPFIRRIKNQLFFSMKKMKKRFNKFMKARFKLKFILKKILKKNKKKKKKFNKIKYLENLKKKYENKLLKKINKGKIRKKLFKSKYKLKYWYKSRLKENLKNKFLKIKNLSFKFKYIKKKIKKNKKIKKLLLNFRNKIQFTLWKLKNHPNLFLYKYKKFYRKNKKIYLLKKLKKIFTHEKVIRLISYNNIRKYPYNGCKGKYMKI